MTRKHHDFEVGQLISSNATPLAVVTRVGRGFVEFREWLAIRVELVDAQLCTMLLEASMEIFTVVGSALPGSYMPTEAPIGDAAAGW